MNNSIKTLKHEIEEEDEKDTECRHGFPKAEWCPVCSKEDEGCDRYHQLKDSGYFIKEMEPL